MKKITFLFFLFCVFSKSQGQSVAGYAFSESTEVYAAVNGTNSSANGDDGTDNNNSIGFIFNFGGVEYTEFSISTNGFIRLGNDIAGNNWVNVLADNAAQTPFIAAFWDDHNRTTGNIRYQLLGTAPSRTLEVGWNNINISNGGNTSATSFASFKMRLHETTGQIDFIYGNTMNSAGAITASIGLNDLTSFLSVTPSAGTATVSSAVANNAIAGTGLIIGKKYTFMPQPQCSGSPAPGDTVASEASICEGFEITLGLQNQSNDFGLSYQWQSSLNGTTYTDIDQATGSILTVFQDQDTYYQCIVTCGGLSTISTPVQVIMNDPSTCYCNPFYTIGKTDGDLISNVTIAGTTLANNTGIEPVNPWYTYFTGLPNYTATLQAGVSYDISVTVGTYQQQNIAVWIDYNDDHVFSTDERVGYTTAEIDSNGTGTFPIVLACDPPAGIHRMRIRDVWNLEAVQIDPCATYAYGETEDYDITIEEGEACPQPYALDATSVNSSSAILVWASGCGQVAWDVHVTTTGGGLVGAPSHANVTSPLSVTGLTPFTDYEFYVMAYCGAEGNSSWAGPFLFTTAPMAVANDDCEGSFSLTPGGDFNEYALTATNLGATKTIGPPNPTCAIFGFGGDVWFSIVVPADGNITIETQSEPGSPLMDTGLTAFTGTCGSLTTISCSDDEGIDAFSRLNLTGLTPGETIYARVWEYANDTYGQFRVSAWSTSLGSGTFEIDNFKYYPNPIKDVLNLSYTENITKVMVYNLLGQEVLLQEGNSIESINMSSLAQGNYIIKVFANETFKTIKVIKE